MFSKLVKILKVEDALKTLFFIGRTVVKFGGAFNVTPTKEYINLYIC